MKVTWTAMLLKRDEREAIGMLFALWGCALGLCGSWTEADV
jgi:hypothetical protein